jgi:uroporphyrinogen-III C-methyltransferase (EC 2.1.1.107)
MAVPDLAVHRPGPLPGWVYLVGAGPGDPELFTLRGARLVAGATSSSMTTSSPRPSSSSAPASAERIYVGKKAADHSLPQDEINLLLLKLARENKRVVRLKGGDPFIFGRGGEEMELLVDAGIHVEVVPA